MVVTLGHKLLAIITEQATCIFIANLATCKPITDQAAYKPITEQVAACKLSGLAVVTIMVVERPRYLSHASIHPSYQKLPNQQRSQSLQHPFLLLSYAITLVAIKCRQVTAAEQRQGIIVEVTG